MLDDALTYKGDATLYYYYDSLHRLTRETCSPAQGSYRTYYDYRYTYDAVGNRNMKYDYSTGYLGQQEEYSYSAQNELVSINEWKDEGSGHYSERQWELGYDLRGNLTKKGQTGYWYDGESQEYNEDWVEYLWDSRDLLTKTRGGYIDEYEEPVVYDLLEYRYDLLGRRVAKKYDGGPWKWYFFDGLKVIAEGTGTNDKMFYTLAPGAIGGIISRDNNGTKYWYHTDRLGNVMAVTDSNGAAYAVYTMDAWGNVLEKGLGNGYSSEHGTDPQPYHLTTKEYDPNSQLYYFSARWYDPTTARFLSRAAASFEHPYTYVENNPTGKIDPAGTCPQAVPPWVIVLFVLSMCAGSCDKGDGGAGKGAGGAPGGAPNGKPGPPPLPPPDPKKPWQAVCSRGGSYPGNGFPSGTRDRDECDPCCIDLKSAGPSFGMGNLVGADVDDCLSYCYTSVGDKYQNRYYGE